MADKTSPHKNIIQLREFHMCLTDLLCSLLSTAGQTLLAEGLSGTRTYGWYTLSLTVEVSEDFTSVYLEKNLYKKLYFTVL